MTNNARDEYIVFSESQCVRCFTTDGIKKAMEEIGPCAVVRRITDGELSRVVTSRFSPSEPDEYEDEDTATRRWNRSRSFHFSMGKSAL